MDSDGLKGFFFNNLLLEEDLARLEASGVEIGHAGTVRKDQLVDVELFEASLLKRARKMADFYVLYYCMENSIRRLISDTLSEQYGVDWWDLKVPGGVKETVIKNQEKEAKTPFSIRSSDPLLYTNLGELIDVMNANWADFSGSIRSQSAMQAVLAPFNAIRSIIAHSGELSDDEIARFELLIKDWQRIQT